MGRGCLCQFILLMVFGCSSPSMPPSTRALPFDQQSGAWPPTLVQILGGSLEKRVLNPSDMVIRSDGIILIADSQVGEVSSYTLEGERLGTLVIGPVVAIDLGPQDELYVLTQHLNPTLNVYSSTGTLLRQPILNLEYALDLAVAPTGEIYVAAAVDYRRSNELRIHRYNSSGNHVLSWSVTWGFDLDVTASGNIVIPETNYQELNEYSPEGERLKIIQLSFNPHAVLPGTAEGYLVAHDLSTFDQIDPGEVTEITAEGREEASWGTNNDGVPLLRSATKLARAPDGTIAVLDSGFRFVRLFDPSGHYLAGWTDVPPPENRFSSITAFALRPSGESIVLDASLYRSIEMDAEGELKACRGIPGFGIGMFVAPLWAIAVNASGETLVGDHKTIKVFGPVSRTISVPWGYTFACDESDNIYLAYNGILKINRYGNLIREWHEPMYWIRDLAFNSSGNLVAIDEVGSMIFILDTDGPIIRSWPLQARLHSGIVTNIAVDSKDRIYTLWPFIKVIDIYSMYGRLLGTWVLPDSHQMGDPVDLTIDAADQVWIADGNSRQLLVFSALPDSISPGLPVVRPTSSDPELGVSQYMRNRASTSGVGGQLARERVRAIKHPR